jgi:hypothetical protein
MSAVTGVESIVSYLRSTELSEGKDEKATAFEIDAMITSCRLCRPDLALLLTLNKFIYLFPTL